ncbi:protein adenylyltransferase SelO [Primorskyibacter sp. S187A]|uniref:protein adenylyltransferase SelO n=1 Tax=Primorskyibacter sp. S187A TaxID=3415130 RepID=UPI003C7A01BB
MTLHIPFDNSFARLPEGFAAHVAPEPVQAPELLVFNLALAEELGLRIGAEEELAQVFSGNHPPEGASPLAQIYAGHQFGHFNPQLGDGRAILLGEVVNAAGRFDIQLKGSGRTPFSRSGDGRAWLGPVLREYVVSEAMHAMGLPTTRALAAVATGETVYRETALPGAVLTRVARSHLRVGTFQIFAARRQLEHLQTLFDYAVARHDPDADNPLDFLRGVIARQADLVARWMSVGFIHGVMNTDNCTISGETIDYGPCAFMDRYDPHTVFSSIDRQGRYAYANQPDIIVWNMAQLATSLVPLMPDSEAAIEQFTEAVHAMPGLIRARWLHHFGRKIGLTEATPDDARLITDLLQIMADHDADFTNTFRALSANAARDQFTDPAAFDAWEVQWRARLAQETAPQDLMRQTNPARIPRNHRIEQMIEAAVAGDLAPFKRMMDALSAPYETDPRFDDLTRPPLETEIVQATFCGT